MIYLSVQFKCLRRIETSTNYNSTDVCFKHETENCIREITLSKNVSLSFCFVNVLNNSRHAYFGK